MMKRSLLFLGISATAILSVSCSDRANPVGPEARAVAGSRGFDLVTDEIFGAVDEGQADPGAQAAEHVQCSTPYSKGGEGIFVLTSSGHFTLVCHAQAAKVPADLPTVTQLEACNVPTKGTGSGHVVVTPSGEVVLVCTGSIFDKSA
jgi:hypothetical protein